MNSSNDKRLFWACFIALVATAFGFIIRAMIMDEWAAQFGLTATQKGEIFGVGLWPFAISIVLFSLVIDRIGYGVAMVFAFICHVASAVITISTPYIAGTEGGYNTDTAYWMLWGGNFIVALGNGTVEAVINPVVATMFAREKTKWLNILHAGWPGGLVMGGLLTIGLASSADVSWFPAALQNAKFSIGEVLTTKVGLESAWQLKVGLLFIPVLLYAILMVGCTFPVSERVAAGVSYRDMLKEVGFLGAFAITALIVFEVSRVIKNTGSVAFDLEPADFWSQTAFTIQNLDFTWEMVTKLGIIGVVSLIFGIYSMSIGRLMFFFLIIIMIPLATTELGTDSWITNLLTAGMQKMGWEAGWVLVYTSFIMMVLRFFAGPIVHRLSPLGLLALSAAVAAVGLVCLSYGARVLLDAEGEKATLHIGSLDLVVYAVVPIAIAATIYGLGKTFFWPTMLGVVAEQFPRGGALTLNMIAGIGMLGVGVLGNPLLGYIQDRDIRQKIEAKEEGLFARVEGAEKESVFGSYSAVDDAKVNNAPEKEQKIVEQAKEDAQVSVLFKASVFPVFMLICYLILILYFRLRGGYRAEVLTEHAAEDARFTGGVEGPVEG